MDMNYNYAISPRQQQEMNMGNEQPPPEIMEQYNVSPTQGWGNSYPVAPGQDASTSEDSDDSSKLHSAEMFYTLNFNEEFDIPADCSEQQRNMQPMNQQQDNIDMCGDFGGNHQPKYLSGPDHDVVNTLHHGPQPVVNYTMSPQQQQKMMMGDQQPPSEVMRQYNVFPTEGTTSKNSTPNSAQSFYAPSLGEELDIPVINSEQQLNRQPMNQQQDNMDMCSSGSDYHERIYPLGPDYDIDNFWYDSPQPSPNYAMSSEQQQEMMMGHEQPPPESMDQYIVSPTQGWDNNAPHSAKLTAMKQPSPEPADQGLTDFQAQLNARRKSKEKSPERSDTVYQIFFADTHAAIKRRNPSASFGEVSKIVSSMWNALDSEHKNAYKNLVSNSKGAGENDGMGDMNEQPQLGVLQSPMGAVPNHMNMTQHNNSYMQQVPLQHMQHMSPHSTVSSSPPVSSARPAESAVRPSSAQQNADEGAMDLSNSCTCNGCPNAAILNEQYEGGYRSAISHIMEVCLAWVESNQRDS